MSEKQQLQELTPPPSKFLEEAPVLLEIEETDHFAREVSCAKPPIIDASGRYNMTYASLILNLRLKVR
jgi:hypothetical protein